ncbi:MAG: filamentous hemagglutinin [Pseudomonadota bacterium]|nr:filamentous hemagglutinin [Pseudomonadota bacterium]
MHIAGGALVAGLGGGGAGSAAQGAAGAGVAAWTAGDLNRIANGTRDALGGGDAAQTAGNVLANVVAGAGGFLIGGTTGAFTAGNVDLYNRSTGNGDGHGSTENSALDDVVDWAKSTYGSPVDDVRRWAGQLAGQVASNNGQALPADPNPLIDVTNNSKPPAAGGSAMPVVVCVPPVCTVAIAPTPGMPGYVPSNATLNSGNNDASSSASSAGKDSDNAGFDTSNLESKVKGYLLDPDHSQNQSKANWFNQALGFNQSNWKILHRNYGSIRQRLCLQKQANMDRPTSRSFQLLGQTERRSIQCSSL